MVQLLSILQFFLSLTLSTKLGIWRSKINDSRLSIQEDSAFNGTDLNEFKGIAQIGKVHCKSQKLYHMMMIIKNEIRKNSHILFEK